MKLTTQWVGTAVRGGVQTSPMSSASCLSTVWQRLRQCSVARCCVRILAPGDLNTARSSVGGMLVESDIRPGVHGILF
jgi:hypothetical protein